MITNAFLEIIYIMLYAITYPLRILNDVTLPTQMINAILTAKEKLAIFNAFIPLNEIMLVVGIAIIYEVGYITYKLVMWTLRRLPTQS